MSKYFKDLSILYAEDDLVIQKNIGHILNLLFDKVFIVNNGEEALNVFRENRIDIVLTDYMMPIKNGYELTKEIRTLSEKIPVVILSNYVDKEKLLKCIPLNLTQYIEKPVEYERLLETLISCRNELEKNYLLTFKIENKLSYSFQTKILQVKDKEISLSELEITIFEYFIDKKNILISKEEITSIISDKYSTDDNSIKNIIYKLRKKIGKELIINNRNLGYKFLVNNK